MFAAFVCRFSTFHIFTRLTHTQIKYIITRVEFGGMTLNGCFICYISHHSDGWAWLVDSALSNATTPPIFAAGLPESLQKEEEPARMSPSSGLGVVYRWVCLLVWGKFSLVVCQLENECEHDCNLKSSTSSKRYGHMVKTANF